MNDIERNNKTLTELIEILIRSSLDIQRVKELVNLKKELIEPTQPEGYQGLNKWYRTRDGNVFFPNYVTGYDYLTGLGMFEGRWYDDYGKTSKSCLIRLATESEITEAILKGCEQKGIVDGARVSHVGNRNCYFTVGDIKNFVYEKVDNSLWLDGNCIFDNGKFAEVVKQDNVQCIHPYPSATNTCLVCGEEMVKNFNCEDGNCIKQCDKCKDSFEVVKKEKPPIGLLPFKLHNEFRLNDLNKAIKRFQDAGKSIPKEWEAEHQSLTAYFKGFDSTDKELLKECLGYFKYIRSINPRLNTSESLTDLVTKINEHLKHE